MLKKRSRFYTSDYCVLTPVSNSAFNRREKRPEEGLTFPGATMNCVLILQNPRAHRTIPEPYFNVFWRK